MNVESIGALIGGLGIFLFGMVLLEGALRELSGRTFKLFLRRHTQNRFKAIASGALVTGILQSSSVVSLIMLAFVGAGVVTMENALGVVLGANFGTTLDSWIVATLGFHFDVALFAYPVIGVAGVTMLLAGSRKKVVEYCRFFIGFGLLFVGLGLMKNSVIDLAEKWELQQYADAPLFMFFFVGLVLTTIIQSSSATMAITLSALNAKAVSFEGAMAVMIGAQLGAQVKLVFSAIGEMAAKKQVALGNIIYNVVFVVLMYALLHPTAWLIRNVFGIHDDLIALAFFESFTNVLMLLVFWPFLGRFTKFLQQRFRDENGHVSKYISKVNASVIEVALEAFEKETRLFVERTIHLNRSVFPGNGKPVHDPSKEYAQLKKLEGEIQHFYASLHSEEQSPEERLRFSLLAGAVRNAMYSAKSIKDIRHNLDELGAAADDSEYRFYTYFEKRQQTFWDFALRRLEEGNAKDGEFVQNMQMLIAQHDEFVRQIYDDSSDGTDDIQLSTVLNVDRELYSSNKALLNALKDMLLSPAEAERMGDLATVAV